MPERVQKLGGGGGGAGGGKGGGGGGTHRITAVYSGAGQRLAAPNVCPQTGAVK